MLETIVKGWGICYLIMGLCIIGALCKWYESSIYKRLVKALENPDQMTQPFIMQIKTRYKNNYSLNRTIRDMDSFIETSLLRYRHHGISLSSIHAVNLGIIFLCIFCSCLGVALSIHFQMDKYGLLYHILAGALAVAGLEFVNIQSGSETRRSYLFTSLKDYLENVLSNQLNDITSHKKPQIPVAATREHTPKLAKRENKANQIKTSTEEQEQLLADIIKEFFP